jgi:hypothetical protein
MKGNSTAVGVTTLTPRDGALYVKVKSTIVLIVDGAVILRYTLLHASSKPHQSRAWNLGRRRVAEFKNFATPVPERLGRV